jgi:hypothetical protein
LAKHNAYVDLDDYLGGQSSGSCAYIVLNPRHLVAILLISVSAKKFCG